MRTVVGVLRGGPSREYEVSLKTGASVLDALDKEKYEPRDIFVDKKGQWHVHGMEVSPEKALKGVDVVFNAMHGEYGEDGRVQRQLDVLGVPYTGSDAFASSLAYNKQHTKDAVKKLGVKVPHGQVLDLTPERPGEIEALARQLFRSFPHPAIVKPVTGGSSVGTYVAHSYHGLESALGRAAQVSPRILIEEYIPGREATVGVVDNYRGEKTYSFMPTEIVIPVGATHYSEEVKRDSAARLVTPGNFLEGIKTELQNIAKAVHEGLGLSHHSRSDFIVSKRGVYFLEVETSVDLAHDAEMAHGIQAIGSTLPHFIDHVVTLARTKKN
jgi:D-alanine-D-alanine ligase